MKNRRAKAAEAQAAKAPEAPAGVPADLGLVINIPAGKINYVLLGLGKLPLGDIVDLWASIKTQAEKQIVEFQKGPPTESAKAKP